MRASAIVVSLLWALGVLAIGRVDGPWWAVGCAPILAVLLWYEHRDLTHAAHLSDTERAGGAE